MRHYQGLVWYQKRFDALPQPGKRYELKIDTPIGIESKHPLPAARADGVVLRRYNQDTGALEAAEWPPDMAAVRRRLEQDYTLQGKRAHISAPTTVVLRREGTAWRIALFHSIPLTTQA